jgi:hypothetical protein
MNRRWLALFATVCAAAVLIWYFASPYWCVLQIKTAIEKKDSETLTDLVDFSSLKESIKSNLLTSAIESSKSDSASGFAVIGMMFGAALVNSIIDTCVSPAGLEQLFHGVSPDKLAEHNSQPATNGKTEEAQYDCLYESFNKFLIRVKQEDPSSSKIAFVLTRHDLFNWKLSAIRLTKPQLADSTIKPKEPSATDFVVGSRITILVPKGYMLPLYEDLSAVQEHQAAQRAGDQKGISEISDDRLHWMMSDSPQSVELLVLADDMPSYHNGSMVKVRVLNEPGDFKRDRKGWMFAKTLADNKSSVSISSDSEPQSSMSSNATPGTSLSGTTGNTSAPYTYTPTANTNSSLSSTASNQSVQNPLNFGVTPMDPQLSDIRHQVEKCKKERFNKQRVIDDLNKRLGQAKTAVNQRDSDINQLRNSLQIADDTSVSKDRTIADLTTALGRLSQQNKSAGTLTSLAPLVSAPVDEIWANVRNFEPAEYKEDVINRLQNGHEVLSEPVKAAELTVRFTIQKDGRPANISVLGTEYDDDTRMNCVNCIESAGPFRPLLPYELSNLEVETRLTLDTNVRARINSLQIEALGNKL